jgi:hypothetical protein
MTEDTGALIAEEPWESLTEHTKEGHSKFVCGETSFNFAEDGNGMICVSQYDDENESLRWVCQ